MLLCQVLICFGEKSLLRTRRNQHRQVWDLVVVAAVLMVINVLELIIAIALM